MLKALGPRPSFEGVLQGWVSKQLIEYEKLSGIALRATLEDIQVKLKYQGAHKHK